MTRFTFVSLFSIAVLLSGCITTAMQGYADRDLPARPIQRVAAYVVAPTALASSFQSSIAEEAAKRGIGRRCLRVAATHANVHRRGNSEDTG